MSFSKPFYLITIPISHYCEKARWALNRLGISFIEKPHSPPFHLIATKRLGGKLTPILVTDTKVIKDSSAILLYLDAIAPDGKKLFPSHTETRKQVEELENLFDEKLGVATRLWGYSYLMHQPELVKQVWCNGVPWIEKVSLQLIHPIIGKFLKTRFNITEDTHQQAHASIQDIFDQVGSLLADGRPYLVGDKFTAADLTFAALAAPILSPIEHPKSRNNLEELPKKMLLEIQEMRNTTAGKFGLNLYKNERFS